jgi:hypothetical protein
LKLKFLGIFISSLPNELKAFGNSFSTTLITLLGQLPAPYLYGAIYNMDKTKKTAFNLTLFYSWFGVIFIFIGSIFRMELCNKSKENDNEIKNIIEKELKKDENRLENNISPKIKKLVKCSIKYKLLKF